MIPYHRGDISVTYTGKTHKKVIDPDSGDITLKPKRVQSSWNFSVYNVYNRANPYFIFFDYAGDLSQNNLQVNGYQISLFPILPSITWNF